MIDKVTIEGILIIISAVCFIYIITSKNDNFINTKEIFKKHYSIFENAAPLKVTIFRGLPLILAICILNIKTIDKDIINNLNIVLSIFIAMFFSMLSIIAGNKTTEKSDRYNQILNQVINTLLYEITLCVILLLISFIQLFIGDFNTSFINSGVSLLVYYLLIEIVLNILILLKRLSVIFNN